MNETLSPAAIEARREYKREYMKRWRAKNPEKVKANNKWLLMKILRFSLYITIKKALA